MFQKSATLFSLTVFAVSIWGQAPDNRARRGVYPGGTFAVGDFESINSSNGNVFIRFPLAGLQPAPSGMGAGFALTYSSFVYDTYQSQTTGQSGNKIFENRLQFSQFGGWQYGYEYGLHLEVRPAIDGVIDCQDNANEPWKNQKLSLRLPDGSLKTLRLRGFQDYGGTGYYAVAPSGLLHGCLGGGRIAGVPGALHYYTSDGSFIRVMLTASGDPPNPPNDWATQTWAVYLPDGTIVTGKGARTEKIEDRFGAKILVQNVTCPQSSPSGCQQGSPITRLLDDFGRFVELERTTSTQHYVRAQTFNGEWIQWTINRALVSTGLKTWICTSEGASCSETFSIDSVMSFTIPAAEAGGSGQVYSFAYSRPGTGNGNGWGELREVVTPTGHKTTYAYTNDGGGMPNILTKNPVLGKTITFDAKEDGANVAQTQAWTYSFSPVSSTITNPEGAVTSNSFFPEDIPTNPQRGLVYRTRNPDGSVVEKLWQRNKPWFNPDNDAANPYVRAEFRSLPSSGGGLTDTTVRSFTFDKNGNLRTTTDYAAVTYSSIPRSGGDQGPPTAIPSSTALRTTTNLYFAGVNETPVAGDGTEAVTDNTLAYWNPAVPRYRGAVQRITVNSEAITEFDYGTTTTTRGLVATERRWASKKASATTPLTDANSVKTTFEYSSRGNRTKVTLHSSPLSTVTEDIYGDVTAPGGGVVSDLFLTERRDASGTTEQLVHTFVTDFSTGLVKKAETRINASGATVSTDTNYDRWGRPKTVTEQLSDTENRVTTTTYDDAQRCVKTATTLGTGESVQTFAHYDPADRIRLLRTIESGTASCAVETSGIKTETRYRRTAGYSYVATSNPFRANTASEATTEETMGWTLETQDAGGRPKETGYYSGVDAPSPVGNNSTKTGFLASTYDNRSTKVVDAKDRETTYIRDILGRMSQIDERKTTSTVETTTYTYDARDNLTGVVQGTQTRTFDYDSLGRLWQSTNPESGVVTIAYDDKGNPTSRTDGRFTTTMTYNARNQVRTKTYSDTATPSVTYNYDGNAANSYSLGRLTSVVSDNTTFRITEYDRAGRVKKSEQQTAGVTYAFEYTYYHSGTVASVKYPSGRTVTYGIDAVGRTSQLSAGTTTYAKDFAYAAHGAVKSLRQGNGANGNGLYETYRYNPRLQLTDLRAGTAQDGTDRMQLTYTYGTTDNNGTVRSITTYPVGQTQTYTYDRIQRLKSFTEGTLQRTYDYDRWGNQWVIDTQSNGIPIHSQTPKDANWFSAGNNKMTGVSYDNAGNQTSFGPFTLAYTAENQVRTVDSAQNGSAIYSYDGAGQRVRAVRCPTRLADCRADLPSAAVSTFVYDASGALMAEYGNDTPTPGTRYLSVDALGSTRLTTDATGGDVRRFDYWPFGESIAVDANGRTTALGYGAGAPKQQFTGHVRDAESGLDYFGARHMAATQSRFLSVDPSMKSMVNMPQGWNRYVYVLNNPLSLIDPTGADWKYTGDAQNPYTWVRECQAGTAGTTCFTGISAVVNGNLVVYGSSMWDVQVYEPNEASVVNINQVATETEARFEIAPQAVPENYLAPDIASILYNVAAWYGTYYPGESKLAITAGTTEIGMPGRNAAGNFVHAPNGHRGGSIDMRYIGASGRSLIGPNASQQADEARNTTLVEMFQAYGMTAISGSPGQFGGMTTSATTHNNHRNHIHFQPQPTEADWLRNRTRR